MSGERKLVRSKSGLRMVSVDDRRRSPFEISEPQWDSDREFMQCVKCRVTFDFLTRRHHCRRCGHIFCSRCCEAKLSLPRMCFLDPVRLCASCANVTRKENEFYEKHLKTLLNGANLSLEENEDKNDCLFCKLSSDHRFIVFDGESKQEPLSMLCIQKLQMLREFQGQTTPSGIQISYLDSNNENEQRLLRFIAFAPSIDKNSVAWLSALHKAIKLVHEACSEKYA